jgi:hypothetical protein
MPFENVIPMPLKIKLVCSACGADGEGSCRCGANYVPWKEKAAADAVAAHPHKSNRAIADEIGVDEKTVRKARRKSTTADRSAVGKRTGKDGKTRNMPRRNRRGLNSPKLDDARKIVRKKLEADEPISPHKLQDEHPISHVTFDMAITAELARSKILDELEIDPETLSPSAKAKLEAAKRMMQHRLNAEHAARMRTLDDEVKQRVLKDGEKYRITLEEMERKHYDKEKLYRDLINNHKAIFTVDEFKTILMCLHPDGVRTAEKLADAFRLFNAKKVQLTKER